MSVVVVDADPPWRTHAAYLAGRKVELVSQQLLELVQLERTCSVDVSRLELPLEGVERVDADLVFDLKQVTGM